MISINNYVRHRRTNQFGKVFGYGHKIVEEASYVTTLKVEILEGGEVKGCTEDIYTEWILCEAEMIQRV